MVQQNLCFADSFCAELKFIIKIKLFFNEKVFQIEKKNDTVIIYLHCYHNIKCKLFLN